MLLPIVDAQATSAEVGPADGAVAPKSAARLPARSVPRIVLKLLASALVSLAAHFVLGTLVARCFWAANRLGTGAANAEAYSALVEIGLALAAITVLAGVVVMAVLAWRHQLAAFIGGLIGLLLALAVVSLMSLRLIAALLRYFLPGW